jgi:hypothetical protein
MANDVIDDVAQTGKVTVGVEGRIVKLGQRQRPRRGR